MKGLNLSFLYIWLFNFLLNVLAGCFLQPKKGWNHFAYFEDSKSKKRTHIVFKVTKIRQNIVTLLEYSSTNIIDTWIFFLLNTLQEHHLTMRKIQFLYFKEVSLLSLKQNTL